VVLDVGLTADEIKWLASVDVSTLRIGWDFDVLEGLGLPEFFKAMTWRPFLPKHLPGFDVYVWLDADTWVQDERAVLLAIELAKSGSLVIVPEISRFYPDMYAADPAKERLAERKIYTACFGAERATNLIARPLIKCGFFAMAASAQGFKIWADVLREMYRKVVDFYTEQCSLNYCVYEGNLKICSLPAYCNWICIHALPGFDPSRQRFIEPGAPIQDLWIVHLAANTKNGQHDLRTPSGQTVQRSLRYPGLEQFHPPASGSNA